MLPSAFGKGMDTEIMFGVTMGLNVGVLHFMG